MKLPENYLFIHLLLAFLLFSFYAEKKGIKNYADSSPLYSVSREHKIITLTKNWQYSLLLIAYVTGERRNLPHKFKKIHSQFYIAHLFTPSAIHFGALLLLIIPLFKVVTSKQRYISSLQFVLYSLVFFTLPSLYSIHRVSLYKAIQLIQPTKSHPYLIFLISFGIDFFWGTFQLSPQSFLYSFIFFGSILSFNEINIKSIFIAIAISQLFLAGYLQVPFYPIHFVIGFIYTSIFSLVFPLLFIFYIYPSSLLSPLIQQVFSLLETTFSTLPSFDIPFTVPIVISLLLGSILSNRLKISSLLLSLALVLSSPQLINAPGIKHLQEVRRTKQLTNFKKIERTKKGYKTWHKKRVCFHTLYNSKFKIYCRKKNHFKSFKNLESEERIN